MMSAYRWILTPLDADGHPLPSGSVTVDSEAAVRSAIQFLCSEGSFGFSFVREAK